MRRIHRLTLSAKSKTFLQQERTDKVLAASDRKAEAARLWGQKEVAAFREICELLREMAPGRERCMYCEDSQGTDIEHFRPKKDYPELAFTWTNYLWACSNCNSNHKRDQFPLDDDEQPLLLDPTRDEPADHLQFSPKVGTFVGTTRRGEISIRIFGLARETLKNGRKDAWEAYIALICRYAQMRRQGNKNYAAKLQQTIGGLPFSTVLDALVRIARSPVAGQFIPEDCRQAVREFPEIATWIA